MNVADFDYELPDELIARYPTRERDQSRMLVLNRSTRTYDDRTFRELPHYLRNGDLLILNNTRVIPARLLGTRVRTGAEIELFLLRELSHDATGTTWEALAKPAKKVVTGESYQFGDTLTALVTAEGDEGIRTVRFAEPPDRLHDIIEQLGHIPLPPYMHREDEASDRERYQTVYASVRGAVAAPTAGLHFTDGMLRELQEKGIEIETVLLHTGIGTFRPVDTEQVEAHTMHEEYYEIPERTASRIAAAKEEGRRVIAVGTTSVRALETHAQRVGEQFTEGSGWSKLFIYPGFRFQIVDAMITNFHMPRSTLMMMISAFAGREFVLEAYRHAVEERYRFFSYGDAMIIL